MSQQSIDAIRAREEAKRKPAKASKAKPKKAEPAPEPAEVAEPA